jgi:hypothetical protein
MTWWQNLSKHERRGWAQAGEDGVLEHIFKAIGDGGRYCVEFGAGDGTAFSNTKQFRKNGWDALLLDGKPRSDEVIKAWITRENINSLFDQHDVPPTIDLLSIDIDGNDIWIWEAIRRKARVTIVEYNPRWPANVSKAIRYNPKHVWGKDAYYGASLLAMKKCGRKKLLRLIYYNGLNAIFVPQELLPHGFDLPLRYRARPGHPIDDPPKPWVEYR